MEKRISVNEYRSVLFLAKACNPTMIQRDKVKAKIEKLVEEYKELDSRISSMEEGIVKTVGLRVEELVKKVIEDGVDANGNPKRTTKYIPTDNVSYDSTHKQYVITLSEGESEDTAEKPQAEAPVAETSDTPETSDEVEEPFNEESYDPFGETNE